MQSILNRLLGKIIYLIVDHVYQSSLYKISLRRYSILAKYAVSIIYCNYSGCRVHRSRFTVDIHSIRRGLWQESDELLIYIQIETKYFRPMIQQYFISLTPGPDLV